MCEKKNRDTKGSELSTMMLPERPGEIAIFSRTLTLFLVTCESWTLLGHDAETS
jgi:hypothetical protein